MEQVKVFLCLALARHGVTGGQGGTRPYYQIGGGAQMALFLHLKLDKVSDFWETSLRKTLKKLKNLSIFEIDFIFENSIKPYLGDR